MSLSQNLRPRDHRCAALISCPCAFARNIGLKRWKEKTLHSYVHPSRYVVDSYDRSSSQIYDSSQFSRSPPKPCRLRHDNPQLDELLGVESQGQREMLLKLLGNNCQP